MFNRTSSENMEVDVKQNREKSYHLKVFLKKWVSIIYEPRNSHHTLTEHLF